MKKFIYVLSILLLASCATTSSQESEIALPEGDPEPMITETPPEPPPEVPYYELPAPPPPRMTSEMHMEQDMPKKKISKAAKTKKFAKSKKTSKKKSAKMSKASKKKYAKNKAKYRVSSVQKKKSKQARL